MQIPGYLKKNRVLIIISVLIFMMLVLFFSIRGILLRKAVDSAGAKIKSYNYNARFEGARFKGIKTVFIRNINVISADSDKDVNIDSLSVNVKIAPLLTGKLRIRKIECASISLLYNSGDTLTASVIEVPGDSVNPWDYVRGKDFAGISFTLIRRFFHYIPAKMHFGEIELKYSFAGHATWVALHDLNLKHGIINAGMDLSDQDSWVRMPLEGTIDKRNSVLKFSLSHADTSLLPLPLLKDKYGIAAGFDSLSLMMNMAKRNHDLIKVDGLFAFTGFELDGERLSTEKIRIGKFRSKFKVSVGNDYVELDSSSVTWLNDISLKPYLRFSVTDQIDIRFKLLPRTWKAQDLFNSLPEGMFTSLRGIRADGYLNFNLELSVDPENPDSLKFDTRLAGKDFNILSYGIDDYRMLNRSFRHNVYEWGRLKASFIVGPENPDFVGLSQISPFVQASVMTSEDGSFYYHNGFNPGAFRESIATNIKEGRFARGGSTISMQLVKNVFLTRNKTLARKIEEALIVWLIETKNLVPKQRMYEVYLNIIEWGPGVYGITQASRFYFDKSPAELNLQESVYLASIVPRPKWYKYTFENNGIMRPFYRNYFNRLKDLMVRKEFINPRDTAGVQPDVTLIGAASQVFMTTDTIRSVPRLEELEMLPALNYFERKLVH